MIGARDFQASVSVIKPGMLTTVQDMGRWGFQARGVPVAGPMDPVSHRLANALVGNGRDAALLEVTLLGPELEFEDERLVAVTGADFDCRWTAGPRRCEHRSRSLSDRVCDSARGGRARALPRRVRRHHGDADPRKPRDASGQRHGRGRRPRADRRRSAAVGGQISIFSRGAAAAASERIEI